VEKKVSDTKAIRSAEVHGKVIAAINGGATTRAELYKKITDEKYLDQQLYRMVHQKILARTKEGVYSVKTKVKHPASWKKPGSKKTVISHSTERLDALREHVMVATREQPRARGELLEMPEIAKLVGAPHQLTQILKTMVQHGLVVRTPNGYVSGSGQVQPSEDRPNGTLTINGQRVWVEHVLHIGTAKLPMTEADIPKMLKLLSSRVKV
jgi:DNA-binding HxlR family transcriptional regulator